MHCSVEVLIFADHQWIVATHFERENLFRLRGELLVQMFSSL